jgi:hypothetical protein
LATIIDPQIAKRGRNFRETIPISERLAVTLRFLATGDWYTNVSLQNLQTVNFGYGAGSV